MAEYKPSETAQFSVLVCSPGEVIYSQFGHAAIRLCDTAQRVDVVFDYGVFSIYDLVEFVWDFLTGDMHYIIAARSMKQTVYEYAVEGRGIVEYPLNLNQEEKNTICKALLWNLKLENQEYLYNFFEDNCATRIQILLENKLMDLQWNENFQPKIWRDVIFDYADEKSWIGYGIDLGLGHPADTMMSTTQMMFLPDYLGKCISSGTIGDRCLSTEQKQILEPGEKPERSWWNNAVLIMWISALLCVAQMIRECIVKKRNVAFDVILLLFVGIFGSVICFISFVSIHSLVFPNCNTLWLNPLPLVFAIILLVPSWRKWSEYCWYFVAATIVVYLIVSMIIGQHIPNPSWPYMLILLTRAGSVFYVRRTVSAKNKNRS